MKPVPFEYYLPLDLEEAVRVLVEADGSGKVLSGGQSLVPMLNLRLSHPELLVDVSRLDELADWETSDDFLDVGAAVTHAAFEEGLVPDIGGGLLQRIAAGIGYRAIRNRGTIGGGLAHADPAGEWPTALTALDASTSIRGQQGNRREPVSELIVGPLFTSLKEGEIVERIHIPRLSPDTRWGFYKVSRKKGEFADSMALAIFDRSGIGARVSLGGTNSVPLLLDAVARHMTIFREWTLEWEAGLLDAIDTDLDDADEIFELYERRIHATAVVRAVREALQ